MLAAKRMRRRAGVFLALFGVVALLAGLSVGLSGYLGAAATAGAQAGVASLEGAYSGFRVSAPEAADATAQDAMVRAAVRASVRQGSLAVPMSVTRDVVSANPVPFDRKVGAPVRSSVASIPDLTSRARLITGDWPKGAAQASMQADAAAAMGVKAGDVLALPAGPTITITATWRVSNAADPRWLEDSVALTGADLASTPGWIVIDPSLWKATQEPPIARWTIRPISGHIAVAELGPLQHAPESVSTAVQKQNPNAIVQTDGVLQLGIAPIQQNLEAAAAVSTAPLIVVALLGLITVIELAGMLDQLRSRETSLLRARGTSRRRFVVEGVVEGLAVAIPAAVSGVALAVWLSSVRGQPSETPGFAWVAVGAAVVVPVAVLGVSAARSSRDRLTGSRTRRALPRIRGGALRSTVALGSLLLLLLLAVVAVSQFLLYGSPLAPVSGGGVAVDPLAVSAPALAIAALGLLAIALFPLIAHALERWARRARDLDALALQQFARRTRSALTPIVVLAFAVSGLLLGVCYSGTWTVSSGETRQVQVGTSVRVTSSPPLAESLTRTMPGQSGAAPVAREDAEFGQNLVSVLGIPVSRITQAVSPVGGAVDPPSLARVLRSEVDRPQIPVAATGLALSFTAAPATALPTLGSLVLVDAVGQETAMSLSPSDNSLAGTLPTGTAPWTVHGISLLLPDLPSGATVSLQLRATGGSSAVIPLDSSWGPAGVTGVGATTGTLAGHAGLSASLSTPAGYVLLQSAQSAQSTLPVVISQSLADSSGLRVGSKAQMQLVTRGGGVPVSVAAIVPVIPGIQSGEGILADLGALQDSAAREGLLQISSGEWWITTAYPGPLAAAEKRANPDAGVVAALPSKAEQVLESARVVVWIAGVATALLALLAIGSGLLAELSSRESEVRVLRAVGASARVQSRGRVREWSLLLGAGVVVGVIDGVIVCALLVPSLARTAIPNAIDELRTSLNLDPSSALLALAGLGLTVVVLLAVVARSVRGQARRPESALGDSTSGAVR